MDTNCISTTVSGIGTPTSPYTVSAVPKIDPACTLITCTANGLCVDPAHVTVMDTTTIDMTVTGTGTAADPYVLSGDVILCPEPNGIDSVGCGLQVIPSTDAGNSLTFGTDNNLFVPAASIVGDIDNDNCVNTTVTGTGTMADPFVLESSLVVDPNVCNAVQCNPGTGLLVPQVDLTTIVLTPNPNGCLSVTETPGCPDVWRVELGISDDACNLLECRANGLFVRQDTETVSSIAQGCFGPFAPPPGGFNVFGPDLCATITNPSACRNMITWVSIEFRDIALTFTGAADISYLGDLSLNGGAFSTWSRGRYIGNGSPQGVQGGTHMRPGPLVAPGGSMTICTHAEFAIGATANATIAFCEVVSLWGVLV